MSAIRNTINLLRYCRGLRASGRRVSYTSDPAWLVRIAINRRAGWPDDPGCCRGSCRPTSDGRYPPRAVGKSYNTLKMIADRVNTPRLIVRTCELGEHRKMLMSRIPHRFHDDS